MAIAAPAAFSASPNSTVAADVVGAMLTKWHYLALLAPVVLMLLVARSSRPRQALLLVLLGSAILFASLQIALDLRIRVIRREWIKNRPVLQQSALRHPRRQRRDGHRQTSHSGQSSHNVIGPYDGRRLPYNHPEYRTSGRITGW